MKRKQNGVPILLFSIFIAAISFFVFNKLKSSKQFTNNLENCYKQLNTVYKEEIDSSYVNTQLSPKVFVITFSSGKIYTSYNINLLQHKTFAVNDSFFKDSASPIIKIKDRLKNEVETINDDTDCYGLRFSK